MRILNAYRFWMWGEFIWLRIGSPWWAAVNTAINHLYGFITGEEFSDIVFGYRDLKEGSSA
jgi:hypothetical protein